MNSKKKRVVNYEKALKFRMSKKQDKFLEKVSKEKHMSKGEYLRFLLTKEARKK